MYSSFQAACLRRARMLIWAVRPWLMRLMATLRRIARLRAAVLSRTRLLSSRKVACRSRIRPAIVFWPPMASKDAVLRGQRLKQRRDRGDLVYVFDKDAAG